MITIRTILSHLTYGPAMEKRYKSTRKYNVNDNEDVCRCGRNKDVHSTANGKQIGAIYLHSLFCKPLESNKIRGRKRNIKYTSH